MNQPNNSLAAETALYKNGEYSGQISAADIPAYISKLREIAEETAEHAAWDHVILYASVEYRENSEEAVAVNLMLADLPFGTYCTVAETLCDTHRLFFIRGRKDCYENQ